MTAPIRIAHERDQRGLRARTICGSTTGLFTTNIWTPEKFLDGNEGRQAKVSKFFDPGVGVARAASCDRIKCVSEGVHRRWLSGILGVFM